VDELKSLLDQIMSPEARDKEKEKLREKKLANAMTATNGP